MRRPVPPGREGPHALTLAGFRATAAALLAAGLGLASPAVSQEAHVVPPPALVLDGVPPIPASLAHDLAPYAEFRSHRMLSWQPHRRALLVRRRLHATAQAYLVEAPGAPPAPLIDLPDAVHDAAFEPAEGRYFVYTRAEGGNEGYRLYRFDLAGRASTPLGPGGRRVIGMDWRRDGRLLAYTAQPVDRAGRGRAADTEIRLVDPAHPASDRRLARLPGGGWYGMRFSEDGRHLALIEYRSAADSRIWVVDAASGKRRRVTPVGRRPVSYGEPRFSGDGRGLFATSDRGSEFKRLVYIPLHGGRERVLTGNIAHDVDEFAVSLDAGRIAFVTNEDGSHALRFLDLATLEELPRPSLVHGVISELRWRPGSDELAFDVRAARTAGDVFTYDVKTHRVARWTNGNSPRVNTSRFAEPVIVRWKSFDGREVSGLLYRPAERFEGKRAVIVVIHGGPGRQARAGFLGRNNYLLDALGIALVYPNVRGSRGFGKRFLRLDDGGRREDALKDLGALLDWIAKQPGLDAKRVAVLGAGSGGSMALACAVRFPERLAAAESIVGISDFPPFLERAEGDRGQRRAEHGDGRDAAMRAFLAAVSPLRHGGRIANPLFVVQGRNDPRGPYREAERIVAGLKRRGTPAWFLMANDEGHGFARQPQRDYLYYATVEFMRRALAP